MVTAVESEPQQDIHKTEDTVETKDAHKTEIHHYHHYHYTLALDQSLATTLIPIIGFTLFMIAVFHLNTFNIKNN